MLAALMIFSVIGVAFTGGAAATITADGDFAGDDTDTVVGFAAEEGENNTAVYETTQTFDADAMTASEVEDPTNWDTLELTVEYENNSLVTYTATADEITFDDTATGETPAEVTFTIEDSDLEKLPGDAGENTTADVTVTEAFEDADHVDADADGMVEATEAFTVDYEFATTHAVRTVFDSDDEIVSEFEGLDDEEDGWSLSSLNFLSSSSDEIATIEDDIGINGSETDVHVYSESDNVTDVFDADLEDAEDGDRVGYLMTSSLDNGIVYVFANEPGEKIGGDEVTVDDTYIVANEGGEYDVNLGDNYNGEETASLSLTAGEKFDRSDLQDDLDYSGWQAYGLSLDVWSLSDITDMIPFVGSMSVGGLGLAGLFAVSHRRRTTQ